MKVLLIGFGYLGSELFNCIMKSSLSPELEIYIGVRNKEKYIKKFNLI